jgi:hypothetical protein
VVRGRQNSNRVHGFPPVMKRGSFVRSKFFFSPPSLLRWPSCFREVLRFTNTGFSRMCVFGAAFMMDGWMGDGRCFVFLDADNGNEEKTAGVFCVLRFVLREFLRCFC